MKSTFWLTAQEAEDEIKRRESIVKPKEIDLHKQAVKVRKLWNQMCKHDGIAPDSLFVSFSKDNPFAASYNKAMGVLLAAR